jgi:hypothetical protein
LSIFIKFSGIVGLISSFFCAAWCAYSATLFLQ